MRIMIAALLMGFLFADSHVEKSSLPNQGIQETLLHIEKLGRYRIEVKSKTGCSLTLIDMMSGPFLSSGAPGGQDGQLDVFLDQGTYKIRCEAVDQGSGQMELSILDFKRQWLETPDEAEAFETELMDLEERSFWIHVDQQKTIRLEMMGRNLEDARIWYPGDWMDFSQPIVSMREAQAGKPMRHLEFVVNLNPGIYRVSCYGGKPMKWANEDGRHPLLIRQGSPEFGKTSRFTFKVSPFGLDCFRVSSEANFFQLRTSEKVTCRFECASWGENLTRFTYPFANEDMDPKSRTSTLTLRGSGGGENQWLRVQAEPGTECEVLFFEEIYETLFPREPETYLVSSVSSFEADDSLDLAAVLVHPDRDVPLEVEVPHLSAGSVFSREVNILDSSELFLYVEATGNYTITEQNGSNLCEYRWEPFFKYEGAEPSPFQLAGEPEPLAKGYYRLAINPRQKGIVHFSIKLHESSASTSQPQMTRSDFCFPDLKLPADSQQFTLMLNQRDGVSTGVDIRPVPVQLSKPLTLMLMPGEEIQIPCALSAMNVCKIDNPSISLFLLDRNGKKSISADSLGRIPNLPDDRFTLIIKGTAEKEWVTLSQVPVRQDAPDPMGLLDVTTSLPQLKGTESFFTDFSRNQRQAYMLEVKEPGLYRLETTGRLAMAVNVRTRLDTGLFYGTKNGTGRNALVQEYFKKGAYLILLDSLGQSMGRVGIHLKNQPLKEGPTLLDGSVEKAFFEAGSAIRYPVQIGEPGEYALETLGIGKEFPFRLEDSESWPMFKPGQSGKVRLKLEKGSYSYYTLAAPVESRRVTTLSAIRKTIPLEGKGPHDLVFKVPLDRVWRKGGPDIYHFSIPGKMPVQVSLSDGMLGALFLGEKEAGIIQGGEAVEMVLEAGQYRLEVTRDLEDDFFPYSISIETDVLAPGIPKVLSQFPAELDVVLGEDSLIDLESLGRVDVKARLLNEAGEEVFRQDDGDLDWNLSYSGRLMAGNYSLKLDRNGTINEDVKLTLKTRKEQRIEPQTLPLSWSGILGDQVLKIPFSVKRDQVVQFHDQATEDGSVMLALQKGNQVLGEHEGELWAPLKENETYILWVWNPMSRQRILDLDGKSVVPTGVDFSDRIILKADGLYQINPEAPFTLSLQGENRGLVASNSMEKVFGPLQNQIDSGPSGCWIKTSDQPCQLQPLRIDQGNMLTLKIGTIPAVLKKAASGFQLFSISSSGLELAGTDGRIQGQPYWRAMAMLKGQTWVAALGNMEALTLWNPRSGAVTERATVKWHRLSEANQGDLSSVSNLPGQLNPGECHLFNMNSLDMYASVICDAGLILVTGDTNAVTSLRVAENMNQEWPLSNLPGWVRMINAGQSIAKYQFLTSEFPRDIQLKWQQDSGLEFWVDTPGEFEVELESSQPVWGFGSLKSLQFLSLEGELLESFPLIAQNTVLRGSLKLQGKAGLISLWAARPGFEKIQLVGAREKAILQEVSPGLNTILSEPGKWRLPVEQAGWYIFHLKGSSLLAIQNSLGSQLDEFPTKKNGDRIVYFEPGIYTISARSAGAGSGATSWRYNRLEPLSLKEGQDEPEWFLASEQWHSYEFEVQSRSPIGLGLVSDSQAFKGFLFGPDHKLIVQNSFIYKKLAPGNYMFLVTLEGPPQRYQPRILGLNERMDIPEAVMKSYMEEGQ